MTIRLDGLPAVSPFQQMTPPERAAYGTLFPYEGGPAPSAHAVLAAQPVLAAALARLHTTQDILHTCVQREEAIMARLRPRHWDILPALQEGRDLDPRGTQLLGQMRGMYDARTAQFLAIHPRYLAGWPTSQEGL